MTFDETDEAVRSALQASGATRLAHFTPARNLLHILRDGAIRSSKDLADSAPDHFDPTDRLRFDKNPDKVCCTFQYPNGYYLAQARNKSDFINYPDWVCLFLDIDLILRPGTLFAPCNAASQGGAFLKPGASSLADCFAPQSGGWSRGPRHAAGAATNLQAEALIPGPIELSCIRGIAVPSDDAASTEFARLEMFGFNTRQFSWIVAPVLFDRDQLSASVRFGRSILETPWTPRTTER
ncbi:DarT ssDNA thymidine ADP-ribosyltransferase family protein [Streptomyces sp. enrichment culture]|uniref:DarT ssDNA thymidine ADP-ribosyltransferase family protein n=1 Tax=Streptomyces sp. enrichment culture TaxID=1795815 RepID=UPI003F56C4DF